MYIHGAILNRQSKRRVYLAARPYAADGHGARRISATEPITTGRSRGFFILPTNTFGGCAFEAIVIHLYETNKIQALVQAPGVYERKSRE